jgi:RNase P protein component
VEGLPAGPRLAASTTGKFPNAVQRNRARRLLRETCRLLVSELREPWDILFIVRPAILTTTFSERQQAILNLLLQSGLPVEQAGPGSAGVSPAPEPAGKNPASCAPPKEPALT